jgi:hypothetical protein
VLHFETQKILNWICVSKRDTQYEKINDLQNPCVLHFNTHLLIPLGEINNHGYSNNPAPNSVESFTMINTTLDILAGAGHRYFKKKITN